MYQIIYYTNKQNVITSLELYKIEGQSNSLVDKLEATQIGLRSGDTLHQINVMNTGSANSLWNILSEKWGSRSEIREAPFNEA